jgi:hypothetical protein
MADFYAKIAECKYMFIVDSMHGKLARKLRIFGFDSLYYNYINDDELLNILASTNRILLTGDKELYKKAIRYNNRCILLNEGDENNLVKIGRILNIKFLFDPSYSRCPLCNNILIKYEKSNVINKVPKKVYELNDEFWYCKACDKIYWRGSHIKRILELEMMVNEKILNYR